MHATSYPGYSLLGSKIFRFPRANNVGTRLCIVSSYGFLAFSDGNSRFESGNPWKATENRFNHKTKSFIKSKIGENILTVTTYYIKRVIDFMNKTYLNYFFAFLHLFRSVMLLMVPFVGILSSSNITSTSHLDPVGNDHTQFPGNHHDIKRKFMLSSVAS